MFDRDSPADLRICAEPHPRLRFAAFETAFGTPLGDAPAPPWLGSLLRLDAPVPFVADDALRAAIRDMLRHGGYKPTGRGKPASEYLLRSAGAGGIASINAAVDACNAVSLHSGLPISVVDLALATPPFRVRIAGPGERYVFNASGQEIDLEGLVCLYDAAGPCGNAVKDAQRTKTSTATRHTLSIIWGCTGLEDRLDAAVAWYRELLERAGGTTRIVEIAPAAAPGP
jgi:DNA/RNA-binding domain of Phe-tRNA-synthetase-like protein